MADINSTTAGATESADEAKRFRSELTFPYADLESCVEVAQTLHDRAGTSCEQTELAAYMNQSASGGTFRTRISAAKMFGLIDTGQGRATITDLGRDTLSGSARERAARVQAFLNPELFNRMYEQNKGHTLPPPAAVERQMEQMGISPKQKERARQTFVKSATYAGFIDQATGRFVKPGIASRDEALPPPNPDEGKRKDGNDGNEPPGLHPFVQGLLKELPKAGGVWPEDQRKLWLDTAASIFKMIYKDAANPWEQVQK